MRILMMTALFALWTVQSAVAAPAALTAEQWREDLRELEAYILETHPRPFFHGDEAAFQALITALDRDIERLSDREIVVKLAEIVAAIHDGHTRLRLPRIDKNAGVVIGHSKDPPPKVEGLSFARLPLQFEAFEDGVFVTSAAEGYEQFIGWRVDAISDAPIDAALAAAKRVAFAENEQFERLQAANVLSMPEVMKALGVVSSSDSLDLTLISPKGEREIRSVPALKEAAAWKLPDWKGAPPLHVQKPEKTFWSTYIARDRILYAQINEIADSDEERLAEFASRIVAEAERKNAKLVIDLRRNFGGSGENNRALFLAIAQSEELNQYGRTFALIGRRTFSAAQTLANLLETYTRTLFAGEPTGARPDHFGDAKRIQLAHSGLTLRVSSLHWSSFMSNDARKSLTPDLPAPWTSEQFFSGHDPALNEAISYKEDLKSLVKQSFVSGDDYKTGRYLLNARLFPDTASESVAEMLLTISNELLAEDRRDLAKLALLYGLYFHPDDEALISASAQLDNQESDAE